MTSPIKRILVVDDHDAVRRGVRQLLETKPYYQVVAEAADGRTALALARETRPDIAILDISLPGISGIEALAILRGDAATSHIPVVALSANAMPRDIEKGLEAGFFRYLTKPIKVSEFMDTLDLALKFAAAHSTVATQEIAK